MDSRYLTYIRQKAIRKLVWFKVLSELERSLVNCVIKVTNKPRSPVLMIALARIIVKIKRAMRSPLDQLIEEIGRPLAKKISMIALKWGYKGAENWAEDKCFIRYLTIINVNNSWGFKLS